MDLRWFEFRTYERSLLQPLRTSHGIWAVRAGIIVRLTDAAGRVGFGEIAPLPWFGSESLEDAIALCQQLPQIVDRALIDSIPETLTACRFGLESGWLATDDGSVDGVEGGLAADPDGGYCALLPAGEQACSGWERLWEQGFNTFKWKIGVGQDEFAIFEQLIRALPETAKLRLDANAGLSLREAQRWLEYCDSVPQIEFLEQPLAIAQFDQMLELSRQYKTAIALDESVATLTQLKECYGKGWRGVFVIKPAIAGSPSRLQAFCQQQQIDAVFSSVLETAIGRRSGLRLAAQLSQRAAGYGTTHWFSDLITEDFNQLWESL